MTNLKLVIPTNGDQGMKDVVSDVFARAAYFTFIEVVQGNIKHVMVEENTASDLKQGTGPIVAKTLKEKGVDVIIVSEVGPGAKTLLEMSGIRTIHAAPGIKVSKAVENVLESL